MTKSIVKPHVTAAIEGMYRVDREKARFYNWEQALRDPQHLGVVMHTLWTPDAPMSLDEMQSLTRLLCEYAGIPVLEVVIKRKPIVVAGIEQPASHAPRHFHQIWIDPDLRQPEMVVHEVAHKVAQYYTGTLKHGANFQSWFALLVSKLGVEDQVARHKQILRSMRRAGLTPYSLVPRTREAMEA